jgi:hypothetical protein
MKTKVALLMMLALTNRFMQSATGKTILTYMGMQSALSMVNRLKKAFGKMQT